MKMEAADAASDGGKPPLGKPSHQGKHFIRRRQALVEPYESGQLTMMVEGVSDLFADLDRMDGRGTATGASARSEATSVGGINWHVIVDARREGLKDLLRIYMYGEREGQWHARVNATLTLVNPDEPDKFFARDFSAQRVYGPHPQCNVWGFPSFIDKEVGAECLAQRSLFSSGTLRR